MSIESRVEVITPEKAQEWLNKLNKNNRTMRQATIDSYARDMKAGLWAINNQGIGFAEDGTLIDGQHRLGAIAKAGVSIKMIVVRGLPIVDGDIFTQETIDRGIIRTVGDALHMTRGLSNANHKVAIINAMMFMLFKKTVRMTAPIAWEVYRLYEEEIEGTTGIPKSSSSLLKYAPIVAGFVVAAKKDMQSTLEFIAGYWTGENLPKGDPALSLRNYSINRNRGDGRAMDRYTAMVMSLTCLKKHMQGQKINALRVQDNVMDFFYRYQVNEISKIRSLI